MASRSDTHEILVDSKEILILLTCRLAIFQINCHFPNREMLFELHWGSDYPISMLNSNRFVQYFVSSQRTKNRQRETVTPMKHYFRSPLRGKLSRNGIFHLQKVRFGSKIKTFKVIASNGRHRERMDPFDLRVNPPSNCFALPKPRPLLVVIDDTFQGNYQY